ncbi:tRNA (guanosine(46)-N7)-methyltransferase TrmB [Pacificimonas flava]|uniref:tRNA (guanine-N(7)-)-methyltransferase n=1 Tax=Pacificimonas flava TaxID=1234595 RepID=M2TM21_9SPHN|nr:tRNA (guanosine(46)-N7)-methyltransferase TrmB [Pacificimonas flava]EMD82786.1 tRNA (guanine46-N7-)-methyltransferase [Pacificimonas flava]MBB5279402.1 tRNA (guanine-N7-)-methyltransferase [Pacificimonas flava]
MTAFKTGDPTTLGRLYGRTKGHRLRPVQQALLDELYPALAVPEDGPVTAAAVFGEDRPLHFEIGFGGGEHLAYRADLLPDHRFIGAEPFENGVVSALQHIRDQGLSNIRLHMGDALEVLRRVPDGTLSFLYLLHPDPWPKARHAKRRMMNPGPLDLFAAKLKPGGIFRVATDDPTYCRWSLMQMARRDEFEWLAKSADDFRKAPGGWPLTRYAEKALREGRELWFFQYRRR